MFGHSVALSERQNKNWQFLFFSFYRSKQIFWCNGASIELDLSESCFIVLSSCHYGAVPETEWHAKASTNSICCSLYFFSITNLSFYLIVEINNGIIFNDPLAKPMTLRIRYGISELHLKGHSPAVACPSGIIVQFW